MRGTLVATTGRISMVEEHKTNQLPSLSLLQDIRG